MTSCRTGEPRRVTRATSAGERVRGARCAGCDQRAESGSSRVGGKSRTAQQAARAYTIAEVRYQRRNLTQLELNDSRILMEQATVNSALAARNLQVARVKLALLPNLPLQTSNVELRFAAVAGATAMHATVNAAQQQQQPTAARPDAIGHSGQPADTTRTLIMRIQATLPQKPLALAALASSTASACKKGTAEADAASAKAAAMTIGTENIASLRSAS